MAQGDGKTLEKLYIELGLDLSRLQSDILAADKTVTENLGRLNREKNVIQLRMQADISGLDAVKNATQILEIREKALTEQLVLQKDRLAILEAAYKQVAANQNSTVTAVQNAERAFLREKIAAEKLEAELKSLSTQRISLDTTRLNENISRLSAQIAHVKIQAEIDTSKLQGANAAFDAHKIHVAAVTRELELQRQKFLQLQEAMSRSAKINGEDSTQTLNIKSNVLQQIQEIQRIEQKLKELQNTNVNLQVKADSIRQAEQTINERISRINATIGLIRVNTEVDTAKIMGATAEFDKAKSHVAALNQELTLQNSKLAEMQKLLSQSSGTKAINLSADIKRQIQAIDQLKAKIQELNKIQPPKSGLLSGYLNIKGDVAGKLNEITTAFSQLKGATSSADSAIVSVLGVIDAIPHPVGKAVTALASLPIVFKGIENSIVDLTKAAAASGDAVYIMSRGFQMSIADTAKFSAACKTAGVEVNDLATSVKFVQRQIARGGEDNRAAEQLRRYGESAYDASGNIKDLNEMTFALNRALKAAQAEGKGSEFIFNVFRNVSADAITAIEDWADVNEQASHIVKASLANPKLAHEVQGNINAMNLQAGHLSTNFNAALLPVANEIIPRMTERMGKFTSLIADNKDLILSFGRDLAAVWGAVENAVDKAAEGFGELAKLARDNRVVRQTNSKDVVDKYKDDWSVKSAEDLVKRQMADGGYSEEDLQKLRSRQDLYRKEIAQANTDMKKLWEERRKIFAEDFQDVIDNHIGDASIKTATDLLNKLTDEEKEAIAEAETGFGSLLERVAVLNMELQQLRKETAGAASDAQKLKTVSDAVAAGAQALQESEEQRKQRENAQKYFDEAGAIRYKMNHSDYENQKFDNYRWLQEQLKNEELSEIERAAIRSQYAAQNAQIEQKRADQVAEIEEQITSIKQTELENRLAQIEKEKEAWIQKGVDEVKATEWAEQAKADAQRNAAMNVLKSQGKEYAAYLKGGLEGLEAYKLKQLRKSGVNPALLDMTPEQLQDFQRASKLADNTLLPNFMTDADRDRYQRYKNGLPLEEPAVADLTQGFSELTPAVQSATEALSELSTAAQDELTNSSEKQSETPPPNNETPSVDSSADLFEQLVPEIENVTLELSAMAEAVQGVSESLATMALPSEEPPPNSPPQPSPDDATVNNPFSQLEPEITNLIQQLSSMNTSVQGTTQEFSGMNTSVQGTAKEFSGMSTSVQGTEKNFSAMSTKLQGATETFSGMNTGLREVTVKVNNLAAALQELTNRAKEKPAEKQPVEVSTSVSINEATAWDSEHIQQLADKVADKIKDAVVRAIGGDSNSY